jgi:hypothetical protein
MRLSIIQAALPSRQGGASCEKECAFAAKASQFSFEKDPVSAALILG